MFGLVDSLYAEGKNGPASIWCWKELSLVSTRTKLLLKGFIFTTVVIVNKVKRLKRCVQLFMENPLQSYGASPAIRNHIVLSPTQREWTCWPVIIDLSTPSGWKAEWVVKYTRHFTCSQSVTHSSGVEPTISWS